MTGGTGEPWTPLSVAAVHGLFRGATFRWYIAGGYALELATGGAWRQHDDVDVGVCRHDLRAVHRHLIDWDLHVASAGHLSPWDGRSLFAERQQNNIWVRQAPGTPWVVDITVGGGDDDVWWSRRDPRFRLPWEEAIERSASGVPYLAPHAQLLMKSQTPRPKDDLDAEVVIPALPRQRRSWLARRLPPDHPWQGHCARSGSVE